MRRFNNHARALALGLLLAALAGCSEYIDRRDTVSLSGGDAVAANKVTQMVDPWPAVSAQKSIGFSGERMETAVERYRTNRSYQPIGIGTSGTYQQQPSQQPNNTSPVGPTVTQPAAPVK
ncbi:MAG TPA: hypothetical protein VFB31_08305 [Pseudolabrys sp.]|nr:hypothetical protein [Pseudolabrys sp.]